MDYDTMEAGPELDRLIAEKVMDWRHKTKPFSDRSPIRDYWINSDGVPMYDGMPAFSTDMGVAWKVLEKIENITYGASGDVQNMAVSFPHFERDRGASPLWRCYAAGYDTKGNDYWIEAYAPTAPLAICRAALKAVEAGKKEG